MKFKIKQKYIYSFLFVVIILIMMAYSGYREDVRKSALPATLAYHLDCQSDKIDQTVLDLHKNTILIGAYVEFDKLPYDEETQKVLEDGEIYLDKRSQLFEISPKIRAEIPIESLCNLAALESVKYINIPKNGSVQKYEAK